VKSTRWGLLGAGWIATKAIAPAMHNSSQVILQAVASRDPSRAKSLNPVTIHQSYQSLLEDPLVDAVYISLPNHLHSEWTIKALEAGKHVLCEKPFAINLAQAQSMVAAAQKSDRLLAEAVWNRWHPRMAKLVDYVKSNKIGEIISIDSSFCFPATLEGNFRLFPEMGGGALFDIGVYPLHAIAALLGNTSEVSIQECEVKIGPSGIDLTTKWRMQVGKSCVANVLVSFEQEEKQSFIVQASTGSLELTGNQAFTSWKSPSSLKLGDIEEEFEATDPYQLMIESFGRRIHGQESWILELETSLWVQKVGDQLRKHISAS
jgi:predicted dehydrogenase